VSVEDTKTVDAFTAGDAPGEAILFVFDHLSWDDPGEHLQLLQDKINAYLGFIESGQYRKIGPKRKFDRFIIRVMSMFPPPSSVESYFQAAASQMEKFDVRLEIVPAD